MQLQLLALSGGNAVLLGLLLIIVGVLAIFGIVLFCGLLTKRRVEAVSELEYLMMDGKQKFAYKTKRFFFGIPDAFYNFLAVTVPNLGRKLWKTVKGIFITIKDAAVHGDWKTRSSFLVMGFSYLARKRIARGLLFLALEVFFILYMVIFGGPQLAMFGTLGTQGRVEYWDENEGVYKYAFHDNSLLILLYGTLTLIFILAFVYAWYKNVKAAYMTQRLEEARQHIPTAKEDIHALVDAQYHKTLLAGPLVGLMVFTIFPIIFMIFLAFTNYDKFHTPDITLFTWVGWENFVSLFTGGLSAGTEFGRVFGTLLVWTVIWAVFATFTNYILGMLVALIINKKGIRFKKLWRTILVMTIAVPQFISLLLMSQLLADHGFLNTVFGTSIQFLSEPHGILPKVTVIIVNIWVGIPYTMLMVSGILMNIPADLYESAKIDGAGPVKQYLKITLPYVLHVTTPSLITTFIGNLNNFGVIYLLTNGNPAMTEAFSGGAGQTDLLITWLYKLIFTENQYAMASVVSILMFIMTAVISLIVYNRSKAVKNEEDFM